MTSICSKHQKNDPECQACLGGIDVPEPKLELTTCSRCNYVYYSHCDICPHCQQSPL